MNRINESNQWFGSMNRIHASNQWIESMNRIDESNQWIDSMNRINASNQCIESMHRIHTREYEHRQKPLSHYFQPVGPHWMPNLPLLGFLPGIMFCFFCWVVSENWDILKHFSRQVLAGQMIMTSPQFFCMCWLSFRPKDTSSWHIRSFSDRIWFLGREPSETARSIKNI